MSFKVGIRFQWEFAEDDHDVATLHCDHRLPTVFPESNGAMMFFCNPPEPSEQETEFRDGILGIHGIVGVRSRDYCVTVSKGRVFKWDEIQRRVESVVKQTCGIGSGENVVWNK